MDGRRKSSFSDTNGGSCVETADGNGVILVRDTTDRDSRTLAFGCHGAWRTFAEALKRGQNCGGHGGCRCGAARDKLRGASGNARLAPRISGQAAACPDRTRAIPCNVPPACHGAAVLQGSSLVQ